MLERTDIIDSELAARLRAHEVPGPPTVFPHRGGHASPKRGSSLEFSEHREYAPGEDTRDLDWKLFARTDRYYLKRYEDERLQRVAFLVDASASMRFGEMSDRGLQGSKFHLAARVAWALASLLLHQGDAVGLHMAGGSVPAFLRPRSGRHQADDIAEILEKTEPGGPAGLSERIRTEGEILKSSAALFVLSDFLDSPEQDLDMLRLLSVRGIRPRILHILHRDEIDLPYEDTTRFLDLEGTDSLTLDPESIRQAYRQEIQTFVREISGRSEQFGIPYALITSDEDPVPPLQSLLWQMRRS